MFDLILLPHEQNRAMLHLYPVTNLLKRRKILMQRVGENGKKVDLINT
jgi:hypothetical protein